MDADARYKLKEELNAQRTQDYKNGSYELAGGCTGCFAGRRSSVCERLLWPTTRLNADITNVHLTQTAAGIRLHLCPLSTCPY